MNTISFDNSSLAEMVCSRRYVYKVVRGAIVPPESALRYGKLFHKFMELIDENDVAMFMAPVAGSELYGPKWAAPDIQALRDTVPHNIQMQLAMHACTLRDKLGAQLLQGNREGFFSIKHGEVPNLNIVGTIDLTNYPEETDTALITDFKTTGKPITADKLLMYKCSSQIFFYAASRQQIAMERGPSSPMEVAFAAGRIARRYILINYTAKTPEAAIHIGEPEPIHQDVLAEYRALISEKAQLARFLHDNPHVSTRDGMSNGGCFFCAFKSICSLNNPQAERLAIDQWSYGFSPYNPELF